MKNLFLILFALAFVGVLVGAHHQIAIMAISAVMYLTLKNQKDEKAHGIFRNRR